MVDYEKFICKAGSLQQTDLGRKLISAFFHYSADGKQTLFICANGKIADECKRLAIEAGIGDVCIFKSIHSPTCAVGYSLETTIIDEVTF